MASNRYKTVLVVILVIFLALGLGISSYFAVSFHRENLHYKIRVKELAEKVAALEKKIEEEEAEYIPTELEARERLGDAIGAADLETDIESMKKAAESFPDDWPTGIFIVRSYDPEKWAEEAVPLATYFLMVKTQGGILYNTWQGAAPQVYTCKSWTEVKRFVPIASDGSTVAVELWRDSELWTRSDIWNEAFWISEDNFYGIREQQMSE